MMDSEQHLLPFMHCIKATKHISQIPQPVVTIPAVSSSHFSAFNRTYIYHRNTRVTTCLSAFRDIHTIFITTHTSQSDTHTKSRFLKNMSCIGKKETFFELLPRQSARIRLQFVRYLLNNGLRITRLLWMKQHPKHLLSIYYFNSPIKHSKYLRSTD